MSSQFLQTQHLMSQSALQLERYFFIKVQIEAMQKCAPGAQSTVQTKLEVGKNAEENRYMVALTINLAASEGQLPPYTGEIVVVGFFIVLDGFPKDDKDRLVGVNGASILYGAARELIINTTARGPWPPVVLPCMNFQASEPQTESAPLREVAPATQSRF